MRIIEIMRIIEMKTHLRKIALSSCEKKLIEYNYLYSLYLSLKTSLA